VFSNSFVLFSRSEEEEEKKKKKKKKKKSHFFAAPIFPSKSSFPNSFAKGDNLGLFVSILLHGKRVKNEIIAQKKKKQKKKKINEPPLLVNGFITANTSSQPPPDLRELKKRKKRKENLKFECRFVSANESFQNTRFTFLLFFSLKHQTTN
jgi:hypothetical protein